MSSRASTVKTKLVTATVSEVSVGMTRDPKDGSYVLANVRDKVVQDADDTEGTGTWPSEEVYHLSSASLQGCLCRRGKTGTVFKSCNGGPNPKKMDTSKADRNLKSFVEPP